MELIDNGVTREIGAAQVFRDDQIRQLGPKFADQFTKRDQSFLRTVHTFSQGFME
ncbi:hypothetical protein D3C71_2122560 [compost metagenome]